MSSRLLTAITRLLIAEVLIAVAWLAVCVVAMLTGHTDALPGIGSVRVTIATPVTPLTARHWR